MYVQFMANILRTATTTNLTTAMCMTTTSVDALFKSNDKYRPFCRQLMLVIKDEAINPSLIMNALIVLMKLRIENMFSIIWPPAVNKQSNQRNNAKMFDSINMALDILGHHEHAHHHHHHHHHVMLMQRTNKAHMLSSAAPQSSHSQLAYKLNALNFLDEFVKYDVVRGALEK